MDHDRSDHDDADREAILARRSRWLAKAIAGVAISTTLGGCYACLGMPYSPDAGIDAGPDAGRDSGQGGDAGG